MKNNNKAFTLIELLAVIVILAIIALIATPIVLNIINESKESATLRSAEFYLKGVETSISTAILKDKNLSDGTYNLKDGNICLNTDCTDKLEVEVSGKVPDTGTITITSGTVSSVELVYGGKTIVQNTDGKLTYVDGELKYTIGQPVKFNPGDGEKTWNVIDEDAQTVTLMLTENLGTTYAWYKYSNQNSYDNSYGPKDALEYLNSLTTEWDNVDPIKNYTYINNLNGTAKPYGYQKIEIKNGATKLTHKDGETITNVAGESKARLLTLDEVFEIAQKTNTNLTEENLRAFIERNLATVNAGLGTNLTTVDEGIVFATQLPGSEWLQYLSKYMQTYYTVLGMINEYGIETTYDILLPDYLYQNLYTDEKPDLPWGYWTLSSYADGSSSVWIVSYDGDVGSGGVGSEFNRGVRPVITISKSIPLQTVEQ